MPRVRQSLVHRVGVFALGALVAASVALAPALPIPFAAADGNEAPGNPGAFRSISAGENHTCAILGDGTLKCWGRNNDGQLGLGDTTNRGDGAGEMGGSLPAVNLGTGRSAVAVSAGGSHTCAILDNGTVKCWGHNDYGQLGLGNVTWRGDNAAEMGDNLPAVDLGTGRTATAISAGYWYTCARLDNGAVKCWGYGAAGQLGQGNATNRGDEAGQMGDNLPAVNLGTGRTATAVSAGASHACALLDNATIKCWGWNGQGQLGLGTTDNRGDSAGEMGDNLPTVSLGTGRTATAISAGYFHTCALLDNATTKCWGHGGYGALGLGTTDHRGDSTGEMGDNLPIVSLGTGRTATAVSVGRYFTCALLDNATTKCWGYSGYGQLGLGTTHNRGDGAGEMGDNLPAVALGAGRTPIAVTAGDNHTCAWLDDASLKCWGLGYFGQLGSGDTSNRGDNGGEMGDSLPVVLLERTGVSGTITETGSGTHLAGSWVAVLRTANFSIAAGTAADASGDFSVEVAPGSYYLYLVDPTGAHTAGFDGPPTVVTVNANHVTSTTPSMASTRGAVEGMVYEASSGEPIDRAWVVTLDGASFAPETGVIAEGGRFRVAGLRPGHHFVAYLDPTGAHAPRFYIDSTDVPGAHTVDVSAGDSTRADGFLPTQTALPGGDSLKGVVTATDTGAPLAGVYVIALRAADYRFARGAITDGHGAYDLDLAPGGYKLEIVDSTGLHDMEWHRDHPYYDIALADTADAPDRVDADLNPRTATLTGTIVDDPSTTPLGGVWVIAISPNGSISGGAITAPNGTYTISGLAPGTYRATFADPNGGHRQEYWTNSPDYAGATPFTATAGATITINAALALP